MTSDHVKELTTYLAKSLNGIAELSKQDQELAHGYPYAIVCAVRSEYDPYEHPGVGGQTGVQHGQVVTFIVAAWIREMGFRATIKIETTREQRPDDCRHQEEAQNRDQIGDRQMPGPASRRSFCRPC